MCLQSQVFVLFDGKELEQDIGGVRRKTERLVVLVTSPAMENSQLLCAPDMENKTGRAGLPVPVPVG